MKTNEIETIIIGGGISGLSCARHLQDAKKDFLLITKEIGGRMLASKSFEANYGAAYVTKDYVNVLKYVKKEEPMKIRDFYFFDGKKFSHLFSLRNFRHYLKIIKLLILTWRIRNHLKRYRKQAPYKSMKECFEEDPFLMKYWLMPAKELIKKYGLKKVDHYFVDPVTAATAFVHSEKVNAIYFVSMMFPVIIKSWIANFEDTEKKLTRGYKEKIKIGSVIKVKKNKKGNYNVHSSIGNYTAKNVVFAAPQKHLSNVYKLPEKNIQQNAYVFHIRGERKNIFKNKKAVIFQQKYYDLHMIWQQKDGTDIAYTLNNEPDFDRYYLKHKIIKKTYWEPAMIVPTCCLIDQILDKNLYFASDLNVSGLEDAYLSGLYAANQIINNISQTIDPVCNMKVHSKKPLKTTYKNKTYYFCGSSCKWAFRNDPEEFLKK